jgi:SET domain-containing protein
MVQDTLLARRPVSNGFGVFALRAIEPGRRLLDFTGPVIDRDGLDAALERSEVDNFLQISADSYMGPSGGLDDFVNHSCKPNCGLRFSRFKVVLAAINPIAANEEITFDYASTQNAYPYRFACGCGSPICRQDIGDFDDLPYSLKWKYYEHGILAPYLSASLTGNAGLRNALPMEV